MKHYLTFQDDTSDKFWQIEANGNSFTVTYGRSGTTGQSQIKTFETGEICLKEAEKVLLEKRRKGYEEIGFEGVTSSTKSKIAPLKEDNLPQVLSEYDAIIKKKKIDDLLPFLQKLEKRHYEPVRKHIRKARLYWLEGLDYWSIFAKDKGRGNEIQKDILLLSFVSLLNKKPSPSNWEVLYIIEKNECTSKFDILLWAKHTWLAEYLDEQIQANNWINLNYFTLRKLEALKLLTFNPRLYACCLATFSHYYVKEGDKFDDYICTDSVAIERDIPELFNYETTIQNRIENWQIIFTRLLTEGKIERKWFLESCLQVQTKEWNNSLKLFYRNRLEEAKPTQTELVEMQLSIQPMLHASHNQVVNFGVTLLKNSYEEQGFDTANFLDWVAPVMMRDDCKGSLKTLLTMFEKIAKKSPELIPQIMDLSADTFAINDLTIQEKAGKLIQKYASLDNEEIKEKLALYAPQMLGNIKSLLSDFNLENTEKIDEILYQFSPNHFRRLPDEHKIHLPQTWQELLNFIGDNMKSGNVAEVEIILNSIVLLKSQYPKDFKSQCEPYLKLLENTYYNATYRNLTRDFLVQWMKQESSKFNPIGWMAEWINYMPQSISLQKERLKHIERKLKTNSILPLLSLPTHRLFWIEPKIFVERLIAYEKANEVIDSLDLAIAISRMPRERVEEAIPLCKELSAGLSDLMKFCLGVTDEINLYKENSRSNFMGKVLSTFNLNKKQTDFDMVWIVAARTFYPNKSFEIFENTSFAEIPNVIHHFEVEPYFKKEYVNKYNQTLENILFIDLPKPRAIPNVLLNCQELSSKDDYYNYLEMGDVFFWHSLIPQNLQNIYIYLLTHQLDRDRQTSGALEAGIRIMITNSFQFNDFNYVILAASSIVQKREHRGLAAEVLILHFQNQTIEPEKLGDKLGFLFINKYAPVARLIDVINLVKDVSSLHNQALTLMLNTLLIHFKNASDFPTNFKKLLEVYFDLLNRTNKKPSDEMKQTMESWQKNNSLKSIIKQIINLS